jgi:hypothetical protein
VQRIMVTFPTAHASRDNGILTFLAWLRDQRSPTHYS